MPSSILTVTGQLFTSGMQSSSCWAVLRELMIRLPQRCRPVSRTYISLMSEVSRLHNFRSPFPLTCSVSVRGIPGCLDFPYLADLSPLAGKYFVFSLVSQDLLCLQADYIQNSKRFNLCFQHFFQNLDHTMDDTY